MIKKKIKEQTSTGTGGSFQSGSGGEQYTSALAFGGTTDKKKKKKKSKKVDEGISFTPEKREEDYNKYKNNLQKEIDNVERYFNMFNGFSIEELLNNLPKLKKFSETGEKMYETYEKISNKLEDHGGAYDEEDDITTSKKFDELSNEYNKLNKKCYDIYDMSSDIHNIFEKYNEKQ